jgi:FKBP-type peptidyl-prolyl cis-trans isomerase SlyD
MIAERNKVVSFTYELKLKNTKGESIQQVDKSKPLKIVFGRGNILEYFEKNIEGLKKGDAFEFILRSEEAYGAYNEKAITEFDKTIFLEDAEMDEELLVVGDYIPMETESGLPFSGKILEVSNDKVKMDFNHPLAGQDLYFKGQILDIREATDGEIETGMVATGWKENKGDRV